jgi:predicted transcriptional regulator YdeE
MQPVIQHRPRLILAGVSFFGDPFHSHAGWTEANEIGRLWQRLMRLLTQPDSPFPPPAESYEIHLQSTETAQTGEYEVFAGFVIETLDRVPVEMCLKILPEADYALFTLRGEQIQGDESVVDDWLAESGCRLVAPVYIQRYDQRFKGLDQLAASEIDLLVPILRANTNDRP